MPDLPLSEQQQLEERVAEALRLWSFDDPSLPTLSYGASERGARAALAALDSVGGPEPDKLREEAVRAVEKLLCGKPWAARAVLHRVLKETGEVPNWWPPGDEPLGNQDGGLATSPVTSPLSRVPAEGGDSPKVTFGNLSDVHEPDPGPADGEHQPEKVERVARVLCDLYNAAPEATYEDCKASWDREARAVIAASDQGEDEASEAFMAGARSCRENLLEIVREGEQPAFLKEAGLEVHPHRVYQELELTQHKCAALKGEVRLLKAATTARENALLREEAQQYRKALSNIQHRLDSTTDVPAIADETLRSIVSAALLLKGMKEHRRRKVVDLHG